MGIIEFKGVLNSWAIEEKNIDLILYEVDSNSLILVKSLRITMIYSFLFEHFI